MKITQVKIYAFKLPLKKSLTLKGTSLVSREGLLICLENDHGVRGWGEISPLPHFSRETLPQTLKQIRELKPKLLGVPLPKLDLLHNKITAWIGEQYCSPSTRYGIEMAIITLAANSQHHAMAEIFSHKHEPNIRLNALLEGDKETVAAEAKKMVQNGYKTIKLKVGRETIDEEIEKVRAINEVIENKALLRLDANRAWSFDEALKFGKSIGIAALEYIEEPCKDSTQIEEFYNETLIPVALDESLLEKDFEELKSIAGVDILIIKPTLYGGFEKSWQLMNAAKSLGLRCIVSSSFESGLGLQALAHLAACGAPHVPVGLDTISWFEHDIYKENRESPSQITISRDDFKTEKINEQYLTEVPV